MTLRFIVRHALAPVSFMMAAALSASALAEPNMDKYNKSCAMCHATGAAGAPMAHNVGQWEPRMAKGMDVLLKSVKNGLNAMPPTGLCADCSDEEYKALITFMAQPK